jgi:uncharacterized membrane protein
MRWGRSVRRLTNNLWLGPTVAVVLAVILSVDLTRWDSRTPLELPGNISASSASASLSALGSGMLAFTGFVTSIVLMIVQFGTGEFSPRIIRWLERDHTLRYALSTFIATFLFALLSTALVGTGATSPTPSRTLIAAFLLTLLSITMFLVLIDATFDGLRVASVVQALDSAARTVFDSVYPSSLSLAQAAQDTAQSLQGRTCVQSLTSGEVGAVLVTLDRAKLVRMAEKSDAVIVLMHPVGDHIPAGSPLINVFGATPLNEGRLRRSLVVGDERTIDNDPAFALRVLVDIAIKALSPAVNDPTTAVQSLDRIEDLLRFAAPKHLSIGAVADANGITRLIYPTPTWEDLVSLALDEIRSFGAGQYQIARRLRALLHALLTDVPERRRPALNAQLAMLEQAVRAAFTPSQLPPALVADSQGIGMDSASRM